MVFATWLYPALKMTYLSGLTLWKDLGSLRKLAIHKAFTCFQLVPQWIARQLKHSHRRAQGRRQIFTHRLQFKGDNKHQEKGLLIIFHLSKIIWARTLGVNGRHVRVGWHCRLWRIPSPDLFKVRPSYMNSQYHLCNTVSDSLLFYLAWNKPTGCQPTS